MLDLKLLILLGVNNTVFGFLKTISNLWNKTLRFIKVTNNLVLFM